MRRSGSSSCMLKPKSLVDTSDGDQLSVTVLNTHMLPRYSTERYYMLSEIEQHGYATQFLSDIDDCDKTNDTVASSESYEPSSTFPPFLLLYLLMRPGEFSSVNSFIEGPVKHTVKRLENLVETNSESETTPSALKQKAGDTKETNKTRLYLVVEMVVPFEKKDPDEMNRLRHYEVNIKEAEQLARNVAVSEELRGLLLGVTVALSDDPRAAPGLECCMQAVSFGSRDRRKRKGSKSSIGIISCHPEDLLGLEQQAETDAAQGIFQSRSCAEWNGNGNLASFALRAHTYWRIQNNMGDTRDGTAMRKSLQLRRSLALPDDELDQQMGAENASTWMICVFVVVVVSYLWQCYGDELYEFLSNIILPFDGT